jgi:excinuclease ABC subunit C
MTELSPELQATLNALPHKPGIYLFKDAEDVILYVGKASSLYNRVRSYFGDPSDLGPKNRALVTKIHHIEFIVVGNEVEALILENEYIKRHQPKYNVRLRDDKNYPFIKVSLTEDFPRVFRVRSFRHDGNRYFGPYTNSGAVDSTLDLLNKLFPYRTCRYDAASWAAPRGREEDPPAEWKQKLLPRPCTQFYIHRCNAPCVARTSRAEYDEVIRHVILFLEGKHDEVLGELRRQMDEAAERLEFERAAILRDRVQAVERVMEKQKIVNTTGGGDQDVLAVARGDDEACALVFFFRGGHLAGREFFILQGTRDAAPTEIIGSFVQQYYDQATHIPSELILQYDPQDAESLEQWLRERRGGAVTVTVPRRGDKVRLVEMVAQNAGEILEQQRIKWLSDSQKTALALDELQAALNLPVPPQRIECYDISNIQGTSAVASMVVFVGGKPKNAEYRRFRIKTVEGANDVASHQEVLRRRFRRLLTDQMAADTQMGASDGQDAAALDDTVAETMRDGGLPDDGIVGSSSGGDGSSWSHVPDLVIVDGGRPQLNAALKVLNELDVRVPAIGIAKEDHGSIGTYEEIYLPDRPEPLVLDRGSQALYLLQRVRDEAHRFAITYHRQVRTGRTLRSQLDDIPGIGPKRKKALIKRFGSLRAIAAAPIEDLIQVEGISREMAERVKEHIGTGVSAQES